MPFFRPSRSVIQEKVLQDIATAAGSAPLRKSLVGIIGRALAAAIDGLYMYLDWVAREAVPFTSTDENLEAWAALRGITRNSAATAAGSIAVTFTGTGTNIMYGGLSLVRPDGVAYTVDSSVTSAGPGTQPVPVTCAEPGAIGNAPTGTSLTLASPVAGIQSSASVEQMTGGVDLETDDSLRTRMLQRYASPAQGGNVSDYVSWALRAPGVTRAWAKGNYAGPGTINVWTMMDATEAAFDGFPQGSPGVAADEDRDSPATGDLLAVADAIYPLRPVTALVYSCAPAPHAIDFEIADLSPDTAPVRQGVADSLKSLFLEKGTALGGTIFAGDTNAAIEGAPGIETYTLVSPVSPIVWPIGELPVLGALTFVAGD